MKATAKISNDTGPEIVIDGGGKVTLSGEGKRRILYMNTCDQAQVWTTSHCQDQDHPRLTVQNLTFVDGNSTGQTIDGGGGGAIFVRGGRFKVVNSRFFRNVCESTGPDIGGGAIRVLSQSQGLPVYVTNSTFGGARARATRCSNGGALSSIGVSWVVLNSILSYNTAIGNGANPQRGGHARAAAAAARSTTTATCSPCAWPGTIIEDNHANEGGGAIFFVSNDRSGTPAHRGLDAAPQPQRRLQTAGYPGIFYLGSGPPVVTGSTIS